MPVLHEVMHRHQFERRHAHFLQVLDDGLGRHARIGAAQMLRHFRMQARHAAHMGFVNQGFVRWIGRTLLAAPIESGIDDRAQGRERRAIAIVE